MSSGNRAHKAAIVGLGNIGLGYDYNWPGEDRILTHAHAFDAHPGFDLVGAVDQDALRREQFTARYQRPAYATVAELYARQEPEVVAVAVPTAVHGSVFLEVVEHAPKAIICEKPLARSVAEGRAMLARAASHGAEVMVNYMRRCEPGTLALRDRIASGEFGSIRKAVVWYSKGLANNGSHFIDLMRLMLGEAGEIAVLAEGGTWNGDDPEPDVRIVFGATPVYFLAARHDDFGINAFELLASQAQIRYIDGGMRIELRQATAAQVLDPSITILSGDMQRYQWHVCEALDQHLRRGAELPSDGESALQTLRVVEQIWAKLSR